MDIKKRIVQGVPVLEIVKKELDREALATVFFYHGWQSYKERVLEEAYRLAQSNFRVILPDAYGHGERKKDAVQDPMIFWDVVAQTVRELPGLVDSYVTENKINTERIGVAGLSMGGIITSAILTQYDWVKSASILMGSPSPIKLTKWLLGKNQLSLTGKDEKNIQKKLAELEPLSLDLHAPKLAGRSLYIWHGSADSIVPAKFIADFVRENQEKDYGANIEFELSKGMGHKVPGEIIQRMSIYLQARL